MLEQPLTKQQERDALMKYSKEELAEIILMALDTIRKKEGENDQHN